MRKYKFSRQLDQEFSATLRLRVNEYFKEAGIGKHANSSMFLKTFVAIGMYLGPYFIFLFSGSTNILIPLLLWALMGFSKAFIGTSVMHDALHRSYSNKKWVNYLMSFSAAIIGADPNVWRIQHNVLHHTYTNIEHADEDIESRYLFRFTPNQPRYWFHYFQHIYAVFFYGISTVVWISIKDFVKLTNYRKKGLVKTSTEYRKKLGAMILRKSVYYFLFLVLPIWITPWPFWVVILLFMTMHAVAGVFLSLIFQPAHIVPHTSFIHQDEEDIPTNWDVHQIHTTSNFAMNNRILSWFIGGLNFQIEHHLFPNVCHIHYRKLSKIVQQTTSEFNLPYYAQPSFRKAVANHFTMLRELGRKDALA